MSQKTFFGKLINPQGYAEREQKLAEERAAQEASKQAESVREEQMRIEEKFDLSPEEREREGRTLELEKSQQTELERRAGTSGEDLLREAGPDIKLLLDKIALRLGKTTEELFSEEGGAPARQLLQQSQSQEPLDFFGPELERAFQWAQQIAGRRGIGTSGIPGDIGAELLGRAGVDAAIAASRDRLALNQQLSTQLFNIGAGARQEAGVAGERALSQQDIARNNLFAFLQNQQQVGQQATGRSAEVTQNAFGVAQPIVSQFGTVPIGIEGFRIGQAAADANAAEGQGLVGRFEESATKGLGNLGGMIGEKLFPSTKQGEGTGQSSGELFSKSREIDALTRLLAFSGAGGM